MAIKILSALFILFLVIVVLLSLLTAFTSASAGLANGVAHAAASTALLTSQCLSGFMVLVALIAGTALGVAAYRFLNTRKQPLARPNYIPFSIPRPAIRPQNEPLPHYLPGSEDRFPILTLQESPPRGGDDLEDTLFRNWGW